MFWPLNSNRLWRTCIVLGHLCRSTSHIVVCWAMFPDDQGDETSFGTFQPSPCGRHTNTGSFVHWSHEMFAFHPAKRHLPKSEQHALHRGRDFERMAAGECMRSTLCACLAFAIHFAYANSTYNSIEYAVACASMYVNAYCWM